MNEVTKETSFAVGDNIIYHEGSNRYCEVTAVERKYITMINKLKESHPDEVDIIHTNKDGSIVAHVPAEWMVLRPKKKCNLTDEQKQAAAERFAKIREATKNLNK